MSVSVACTATSKDSAGPFVCVDASIEFVAVALLTAAAAFARASARLARRLIREGDGPGLR